MSKSPEYLALFNYIRNTVGISRDEIKVIIREVITDITKEEMRQYFESNEFKLHIKRALGGTYSSYTDRLNKTGLMSMVNTALSEWFREHLEVKIITKEPIDLSRIHPIGD